MRSKTAKLVVILFVLTTNMIVFQNCSPGMSSNSSTPSASGQNGTANDDNKNPTKEPDPLPYIKPTITLKSMVPNATATGTFKIDFEAVVDARLTISKIWCRLNNTELPCASNSLSGTFVANQINRIEIYVEDSKQQNSEKILKQVIYDSNPPTINFNTSIPAITANKNISLEFSVMDDFSTMTEIVTSCSFDDGDFIPCQSPWTKTNMASGSHSMRVKAVDKLGNERLLGKNWTVDLTVLTIDFLAKPANVEKVKVARFEFSTNKPTSGVLYTCKTNTAASATCSSPYQPTNLIEGMNTVEVTAKDNVNNTSTATYTWRIDTIAPRVFASSSLVPAFTGDYNIPFKNVPKVPVVLTADETGSGIKSYECLLTQNQVSSPINCSTTFEITSVAGVNKLEVTATDNVGFVSAKTFLAWNHDSILPQIERIDDFTDVYFTRGNGSVTFSITDNNPNGITAKCSLNNEPFVNCTSNSRHDISTTLQKLGENVFQLKAIDAAGNESAIKTTKWIIDTTVPTATITSAPNEFHNSRVLNYKFTIYEEYLKSAKCSVWKNNSPISESVDCSSGTYSYTVTEDGKFDVQLQLYDKAWNLGGFKNSVTVDTGKPQVPNITYYSFMHDFTDDPWVRFEFISYDNDGGLGIKGYECSFDGGAFVACSNTGYNPGDLSVALHNIKIRAYDKALNFAETSYSWEKVPQVTYIEKSQVSVQDDSSCYHHNGGVWCWGQLPGTFNENHPGISLTPEYLGTGGSVAAGRVSCFSGSKNGFPGIYCMGSSTAAFPVKIENTEKIASLARGAGHFCGIKTNSTQYTETAAVCWGGNTNGELGIGAAYYNNGTGTSSPANVVGLGNNIRLVSSKGHYSCALKLSTVWCWGKIKNKNGNSKVYIDPVRIAGTTGATFVAASNSGACAIMSDKSVKCWGYNDYSSLGTLIPDGQLSESALSIPQLSGVDYLASGPNTYCSIKAGAMSCWGARYDGTNANEMPSTNKPFDAVPTLVAGFESQVKSADLAETHGCAVVGSSIKCWGDNSAGQLGDGTRNDALMGVVAVPQL